MEEEVETATSAALDVGDRPFSNGINGPVKNTMATAQARRVIL